ncbi:MAG: right-handed parallel beta-helix repeat-containing protein, partial [Bacteroidota bacterium]
MKSLHPSLVFPCNSIVIFILLFSLFHFAVAQNKIYVNASAKGNNDGSSWLHAFSDLQDALALASLQPQKIIYVAEGTYYPTPGINRDISFVIPPYTKLIGGFDSKNKSASISDPNKHPTILSGDLGDFGPSNHVVKAYTNFCINGFIIQEGYGGESGKERHGGGLFIDNQINEDLPQTDSIIKCRFINNDANNGDGGGVYIENGKVGFYQVEFWDNRSRGDGGAVVVRGDYSDISFEEAIFRFNQSESEEGGAIAAFGKKVTISYSEFYANSSTQGGAIYGGKNNILEINNCTFFQNDARRGNGGALRVRGTGFLKHSILWEKLLLSPISLDQNEFSVTFSLIHQGFPGQGNFSSDPLFLNEAFPDLRLSKNSPAINAGDTPGVDLGAYPYTEILDSLPSYSSGIIFVDSSATGNNNGSSWENAFNDLQDALTVAESGNQIWVATGTYYPVSCNPCYWWDLERSFELVNGVEIYGGFRGDELKLENRGTDSVSLFHINPTILSGNLYRVEDTSIGSYTVLYLEGVDPTSLLSGFIIEESFSRNDEGINVDNRSFSGGGIYNLNSSPRIELCIIKDNFGDLLGSGMANFNSSPIISDCVFLRNWTEREGGAIYNFNSSPQIINCKFLWNVGDDSGGGISNVNSSPEIRNCIFFRNYGTDGGGAISNVDSSPKIFNCNFTSNRSWLHGAGFQNINSPVYIENCEFYDNSAIDFGGGIYNSGSSPTITRCFFQGNNSSLGGGGIANLDGSFSIIDNCTFNANYSIFEGGGIANYSSSSTIDNCTFFHNEADFSEDSPRPDNGGGIFSQGGRLSISNSTICYNGDNGIFLSEGDTLSITNSLLAFNEVAD